MAERGARPRVPRSPPGCCGRRASLFTPLLPDDYLELINPLWSTRELRGRIERIERETRGRGHGHDPPRLRLAGHEPGPVPARRGRRRRRPPLARVLAHLGARTAPTAASAITPEAGRRRARSRRTWSARRSPATIVRLGGVEGDFVLPDPPPRAAAVHQRRQRHHADHEHAARPRPARRAARRRASSTPPAPRTTSSSATQLRALDAAPRRLSPARCSSPARQGASTPADLDDLCPDWREREAFLSGPGELLDAMTEHWEREGDRDRLHMERFQPKLGVARRRARAARSSSPRATARPSRDGGKPILVAGEEAGLDAAVRLPRGHLPHLHREAVLRARSATCATAKVYGQRRARWSAPASTRPRATSRSNYEHRGGRQT